jgi:hypothetical protein
VKVHCNEGLAIHIGPEPCVCIREDAGEASAGERIGQPLSRESSTFPNADAVPKAEGHAGARVIASACPIGRGQRPWHVQKLLVREPGDLRTDLGSKIAQVRIGKARSRSQ